MKAILISLLGLLGLLVMVIPAPVSAGEIGDDVTLALTPPAMTVTLGDDLDLTIDVTNTGSESTPDLVVHIDITDPRRASSVDPEDWTATLSKPIGVIEPGQTVTAQWHIQPISPGTFSVYAVALAHNADTVAASNVLAVTVDDRRSLNPNGILPVAIGAPAIIGGLLVAQVGFSRRRQRTTISPD